MQRLKKMFFYFLLFLVILILVSTIGMMAWASQAARPATLGHQQGQLSPCPNSPNCVTTQSGLDSQKMPPISYQGTMQEAKKRLMAQIATMPRTELLDQQENYLAYVFRSRLFRYPDDVEFYFDDAAKQIHFRSASRLGKGDMGVNRARMEAITQAFNSNTSK